MARHGPDLTLRHNLAVNVQLQWAVRFVKFAHPLFGELDSDDVFARARRGRRNELLRRYAEEIVSVVELAVFNEQSVPAETRPLREDHALRFFRHLNLRENLVRYA